MDTKFQVFISSTYIDMKEERQSAVEAILSAGHIPAGMESFTAGDESQINVIKRWIDESDVYLLILGGRYGSIEPKLGKSYIQLEYEYAIKTKKPFFALVIDDKALDEKVNKYGKDVLELENPHLYREFKNIVKSKLCSFYEDSKDIKLEIYRTLVDFKSRYNLVGWVSGKDIISSNDCAKQITELIKKNKDLQKENELLNIQINELEKQLKENKKEEVAITTLQFDCEFDMNDRVKRVINLINAEEQPTYKTIFMENDDEKYSINRPKGDFTYYVLLKPDNYIDYILAINVDEYNEYDKYNIESQLGDMRVMVEDCKNVCGDIKFKFVIASKLITGKSEIKCKNFFDKALEKAGILDKDRFSFEIWNDNKLSEIEIDLGLRVE